MPGLGNAGSAKGANLVNKSIQRSTFDLILFEFESGSPLAADDLSNAGSRSRDALGAVIVQNASSWNPTTANSGAKWAILDCSVHVLCHYPAIHLYKCVQHTHVCRVYMIV